jgi:hypothetical protein
MGTRMRGDDGSTWRSQVTTNMRQQTCDNKKAGVAAGFQVSSRHREN